MRKSLAAVGVLALTVGALAACTSNSGGDSGSDYFKHQHGSIGSEAQSKGPAPEVKGAQNGGTLTYLPNTVFDTLDPADTYYVNTMEISQLFARKLTGYRMIKDKMVLVGDLATNAGVDPNKDDANKRCTTWEYTLKDGVKWQDGSSVKPADVAYGISRTFALTDGPPYFRQWLKGAEKYAGPWKDKGKVAPGITTKGNKITFQLNAAHCDFPYMAAMSSSAAVNKAHDIDKPVQGGSKETFSNGPYKFTEAWSKKGVHLEKNSNWDAKTDPIRHQYFDKYTVEFNNSNKQITERMKADQGDDQHAYTDSIDPAQIADIAKDSSLMKRVGNETQGFVYWLAINNEKVDNVEIRKALEYAIDKEEVVKASGGQHIAVPASGTLSPQLTSYKDLTDLYGGNKGDKAKAKKLLKKHPEFKSMNVAYRAGSDSVKNGMVDIQNQLKEVGIKVNLDELPQETAPSTLSSKKGAKKYDAYMKNWGADWPTGYTVMDPIYNGDLIDDKNPGNVNNEWFDQKDVNSKLKEYASLPLSEQDKKYADLDEEIMKDYAPMVPLYYSKSFAFHGSKVGGVFQNPWDNTSTITDAYCMK
ncbi:MAG TPA: ABC transporter substrate-binding protein [Stackebrandtia sp.]|uniref:ABC transporter substrate-binding protein n=1 Tax=Stackebrandtia sp. TaxID=2023065 RepID=UPI002D72D891|nr:ABC transporter substrate-binding protein [Stackebrandtia sp.]HZE40988.1 ABC transporter substrate-binding protein [Stackebrandtia sp.]